MIQEKKKDRFGTLAIHDYLRQPRHLVQMAILLVTLGVGLQFYIHVRQALGPDTVTVQRPPSVEGFLPIGALMSWKYFFMTGLWDAVHPAAMSIFGFAVLLSLILRKAFCGWFCPIGTISEWYWRMGRFLFGRNFILPAYLDFPLRSLKYILLGFFVWAVGSMNPVQIDAFMQSPYYMLADVKMLYFFTHMTVTTAVVLTGLVLLSAMVKNFWCRYLCPYGALLGVIAGMSPTRIRRSQTHCTGCSRCDMACASGLPISKKKTILSPECTGCMDCIKACPEKEALAFATHGLSNRFWSRRRLAFCVVFFFFLCFFASNLTGHWQSDLSEEEFRAHLKMLDSPMYTHPTF